MPKRNLHITGDKWDIRFLDLAEHIATWSKDTTKVGAIIANHGTHRVIAHGFNGFARGCSDEPVPRERKLLRVIHAESNALHFAPFNVEGASIYVTHPPCSHCAAHIIQRGIARVVWNEPSEDFLSRWGDSFNESLAMFSEAGLTYLYRKKEA